MLNTIIIFIAGAGLGMIGLLALYFIIGMMAMLAEASPFILFLFIVVILCGLTAVYKFG